MPGNNAVTFYNWLIAYWLKKVIGFVSFYGGCIIRSLAGITLPAMITLLTTTRCKLTEHIRVTKISIYGIVTINDISL